MYKRQVYIRIQLIKYVAVNVKSLKIKGKKAKEVSFILGNLSTAEKNKGLNAMADFLVNNKEEIINANKIDLQKAMEKGTSKSMLDRLALNEERIEGMANGLRQVYALPDPVGEVLGMWTRPNGLQIGQKRVPLGVIGIIYEARPNVTSDAAGLCFKAGKTFTLFFITISAAAYSSSKVKCRSMERPRNFIFL